MAFSITWDASFEATPSDAEDISDGAGRIRDLKTAVEERMQQDHYWDPAGTDADHGEHVKVTLRTGSAPTAVANKGFLYAKDVAAKAELHYRDEDGNEVQLTSGGTPNTLAVLQVIYPVGSLYLSTLSTNPATLLGFGTWVAFGAGKTLVGLDSTDTSFDTAEETGGEKTHVLTIAELPSHRHSVTLHQTANAAEGGARDQPVTTTSDTATYTGYIGSGDAHNNLQPYIVVYMWKRTA